MIQSISKRGIASRIAAMALLVAMFVVVSAAAIAPGIYTAGLSQDGTWTNLSHANGVIASEAEVTVSGDTATITIGLQSIVVNMGGTPYVGTVIGVDTAVAGASAVLVGSDMVITVPADFEVEGTNLPISFDVETVGGDYTHTSNSTAYLILD